MQQGVLKSSAFTLKAMGTLNPKPFCMNGYGWAKKMSALRVFSSLQGLPEDGLWVWGFSGLRFRVWGLGFGVWGLEFRV